MTRRPELRWLLPGYLAVAAVCRAPITCVPPALGAIRTQLGLGPAQAGLTTALPLLAFGVFAFTTPVLVARWGAERTLLVSLAVTLVGICLRGIASTVTFFGGTLVIGLGIAVINVVLPAVVRTRFPGSVPRRMGQYTVTMIAGASLASAVTAPLLGAGLPWNLVLLVWSLPVAVALACWGAAVREIGDEAPAAAPRGLGHVVRQRRTWWTALFMGTQSLCFYVPLTWIPDILAHHGASHEAAGLLLGLYLVLGVPGSHLGPRMATNAGAPVVLGCFFGLYALAVIGLLGTLWTAVAAVVVMGVGQGVSLAVALTFIARRDDPHDVPAVSAFAQGSGFLVAAIGPVLAGALFAMTSGWVVPVLFLLAVTLVQAGSGLVLAYPGRR